MNVKKMVTTTALGAATAAAATGIALGGAGTASADPYVCVTGPFGHVTACNQPPGGNGGYYQDRPHWNGPWNGPRGHWR